MDNVQGIEDEKRGGILFPFELNRTPFIPKRVFWITDAPANSIRGGHAHKFCQQCYICIKGEVAITCIDSRPDEDRYVVMKEGDILFVDKLVWAEERFITGEEIFLVLCSHPYDKNDYIYDIKELKEHING